MNLSMECTKNNMNKPRPMRQGYCWLPHRQSLVLTSQARKGSVHKVWGRATSARGQAHRGQRAAKTAAGDSFSPAPFLHSSGLLTQSQHCSKGNGLIILKALILSTFISHYFCISHKIKGEQKKPWCIVDKQQCQPDLPSEPTP